MVNNDVMRTILERIDRVKQCGHGEVRVIIADGLILRIVTEESTMLKEVETLKARTVTAK
jgi:hypothetical protein